MKILLDTHSLLWLLESVESNSLLGTRAKNALSEADIIYVSSISIVEARIKQMLGKLELSPKFIEHIQESGVVPLDFGFDAGNSLVAFPELARHDPFDRMILSQAKADGLYLMTADTVLLSLDLPYVINARD